MKLEQKYSLYLQHGLQFKLVEHADSFEGQDFYDEDIFSKGAIWTLSGWVDKELMVPMGDGEINGFVFNNRATYANFNVAKLKLKALLVPLSDLLEQVADWCYTMQPEHFDSRLSSRQWCEIMFLEPLDLPFNVFNKILSLHGDVFGLIDAGLALPKHNH